MSETNVDTQDTKKDALTPEQVRDILIESNKSLGAETREIITDFIRASSKANTSNDAPVKKISNDDISEFQEYIKELEMDDAGGRALLALVKKVFEKNASGLKNEVKSEVTTEIDRNSSFKEQKAFHDREAVNAFPSITQKNSIFHREAKKEYDNLSDAVRSSPEANKIAISLAAARLGISPISNDASRYSIGNEESPKGDGNGGSSDEDLDKVVKSRAAEFGIDQSVLKEKMKRHMAK